MAVAVTQIEGEVQKRLQKIVRTAKMPGFRPGKVPLKIVAQQYGAQLQNEVFGETVEQVFSEAVRAQNLKIAGQPRFEPKQGGAAGQIEISAVFEVYPEVSVKDFSAATIERPVAEVTAEDVARTIEILRKQRVRYEPVERKAASGDQVIVDFTGTIEGVEFPGGQARDFPIVLGEGRMLPEFEAALDGAGKGESKSFALNFPPDYHGAEVAGKTAQFVLSVKEVAAAILPEVDAEFARAFGIADGDLARLDEEIGANLRLELKRRVRARLREQAMQILREHAELAIPRVLVEMEMARLYRGALEDMKNRGVNTENSQLSPDLFRPTAEERVRMGLVLAEVVNRHGLEARPEQVRALVNEAAQSYEFPDEVVTWHYQNRERLQEFEAQAMEDNVIDWTLTQAKVQDKAISFKELTEAEGAKP
ncbi:MAG: trigger factor [Betaproteobacteria bacterium]|nr:trigger factor [Betaproteobacteria bacterium]